VFNERHFDLKAREGVQNTCIPMTYYLRHVIYLSEFAPMWRRRAFGDDLAGEARQSE